ncbi:MAG: hypothetical protein ACRCZ0_10015 [Cetobacterium sp.]
MFYPTLRKYVEENKFLGMLDFEFWQDMETGDYWFEENGNCLHSRDWNTLIEMVHKYLNKEFEDWYVQSAIEGMEQF